MASKKKRSQWLTRALKFYRPLFRKAGWPFHPRILASCEGCSGGNWGEFFSSNPPAVRVTNRQHHGRKALWTLHHELVHSAACEAIARKDLKGVVDDFKDCHGPLFQRILADTKQDCDFGRAFRKKVARKLGPYSK